MVPHLWCPSVLCPEFKYPNDQGLSFRQRCGLTRLPPTRPSTSSSVQIDVPSIDNRRASIRSQRRSLPDDRQKSSLQKQLKVFLVPRTSHRSLPLDITPSFVWKDRKSKTKVHTPRCPLSGTYSKRQCNCPTRLAAGTATIPLEN